MNHVERLEYTHKAKQVTSFHNKFQGENKEVPQEGTD
jgi:hypothetical protein